MAKLKEVASQYEPPKTKNIADLEVVSTDVEIVERKGKNQQGEEYTYNAIVLDGEDYRVPDSVLSSLKAILQKNPNLKTFSVAKQGSGLNTKYSVVPIN